MHVRRLQECSDGARLPPEDALDVRCHVALHLRRQLRWRWCGTAWRIVIERREAVAWHGFAVGARSGHVVVAVDARLEISHEDGHALCTCTYGLRSPSESHAYVRPFVGLPAVLCGSRIECTFVHRKHISLNPTQHKRHKFISHTKQYMSERWPFLRVR